MEKKNKKKKKKKKKEKEVVERMIVLHPSSSVTIILYCIHPSPSRLHTRQSPAPDRGR